MPVLIGIRRTDAVVDDHFELGPGEAKAPGGFGGSIVSVENFVLVRSGVFGLAAVSETSGVQTIVRIVPDQNDAGAIGNVAIVDHVDQHFIGDVVLYPAMKFGNCS